MKKISMRFIAALLSFLMVVSLLSVTGITVEAAAKPKLTKNSGSILVGGTAKIKIKNVPKGAKITYKPVRKGIASISKKGVVKGIKSGTAKITVAVKSKSKTTKLIYEITVKKPKLSEGNLSLRSGKTAKISVKNKPIKAKYSWTSSNPKIATVSKAGVVTAKARGNAIIRVKIKSDQNICTLQCRVAVQASNSGKNVKPTGITLAPTSASIEEGGTAVLTATVTPDNATDKTVKWESGNEKVAIVNDGKVTGVSAGTATITAKTVNNKICVCKITVFSRNEPVLVFDEFAKKGAELIKGSGEPTGTSIAEDGEFASKRLIVRGKNTQLDFTEFNPKSVIKSKDGIYLIQFVSASAARNALSEISNWPDVEWAEPDTYSSVDAADSVSSSKSWGVAKIGADRYADSISSIRDELVVAVVDSGVSKHTFLSGRIQNGGYDYVDNDSDPSDKHYHGTHVAGTIVDCTPGLNVKVLPVRVLNAQGKGSSFNVGNGIKYAADYGAKVINLSLGGSHSNYIDDNIEYAISKGVTVVASAGNDNGNTAYSCPAHLNKAIVVAAVDENDRKANFSNYGDSVDVAAPGVGIISCIPGGSYKSLNGTSMAAPHVAAVAAMFKLKWPSMTPAQVEAMIKENVRDLGSAGWDKLYGYGIPDLSNMIHVNPTGITLNQSNVSIKAGNTVTLTATVAPSNADDKTVTWSSSAPGIAVVSNGSVTGISAGTAIITASTSNGKTASCTVQVMSAVIEPAGIVLDQTNASIHAGETITLKATVEPDNATDKTVTWSSDKTSVATVRDGKVEGISAGAATITASTSNGKTASCTVQVKPAVIEPADITLNKSSVSMQTDDTVTLTAAIAPDNATDKRVEWTSSAPTVAQVDHNGKVTAKEPGAADITAVTVNGKKAVCHVTVESTVIEAENISIESVGYPAYIGDQFSLTAVIQPENATNKSVKWEINDSSIAKIETGASQENGAETLTVTPLQDKGRATITATTANGKTATFKFVSICPYIPGSTIYEPPILPDPTEGYIPIEQVSLDREDEKLQIGDTITITATVTPRNCSHYKVWTSSDSSVAEVDSNGTVTAKAPGTAVITMRAQSGFPSGDKSAVCRVTVEPVVRGAEGFSVIGKGYSTLVLNSFYLIAIKPDGQKEEIVQWENSNPDVAKIERVDSPDDRYEQVKVTLMYVGKATITARMAAGETAAFEIDSQFDSDFPGSSEPGGVEEGGGENTNQEDIVE